MLWRGTMWGKFFVVAILAFVIGFSAGRMVEMRQRELVVERWTDTVRVTQPEVMVIRTLATDTVWLRAESVAVIEGGDSVAVELPREQAEYIGDGYRAWVSGYRPRLDSLVMERRVSVATPRLRRWSVGIQAGVGMTPRGVQPYVGLGVSFRLY